MKRATGMPLSKLQFVPGINKEGTQYASEGAWYDCDKVRFRKGRPEAIGGFQKYSSNTYLGSCRSLHDWRNTDGTAHVGVGTHLKFYVSIGSSYDDITPIRDTESLGSNPIDTEDGSATVTVNDTAHGAEANDFVTISGVTGDPGGIPNAELNTEHQIVSVPDVDSYTITVTTSATSAVSGGGASVQAEYQINVGLDVFVNGTGWGVGPYGSGVWSDVTAISPVGQLRLWSQDNFGEDLVFNIRGGGVYYWEELGGTPARAVALSAVSGASDAPTAALSVMVSDVDKHVIAFGANPIGSADIDPLLVRWSDQESAVDWTPSEVNSAGGTALSHGSVIIGAVQGRQEVLIWTESSMHSMRFTTGAEIFTFSLLTEDVSLVGPNAAVSANDIVYFMDRGTFYMYSGAVRALPCTVLDYVFSDFNLSQSYKCFAASITEHNEVLWFYPSSGSSEIDRYVLYNYNEQLWSIGTWARGAWMDGDGRPNPIASGLGGASDANYLYSHEDGYDADGSALSSYIESGDIDLDDGERYAFMSRVIPDIEWRGSEVSATLDIVLKGRDFPLESLATKDTATVTPSTKQNHIRVRARQIAVRVETDSDGFGWRLGDLRFTTRTDGRR
jgi:hypothetical protein